MKIFGGDILPALGVGIGVGAIIFFIHSSDEGKELFHSFRTHRKKKEEYGHKKGGHGYKGDRGFYTKKGHHHCEAGSPGCICTDPSKCHVVGGKHGRFDRQHHITGNIAHKRHHGKNEENFDPSEFDFDKVFDNPKRHVSHENLSI